MKFCEIIDNLFAYGGQWNETEPLYKVTEAGCVIVQGEVVEGSFGMCGGGKGELDKFSFSRKTYFKNAFKYRIGIFLFKKM